MKSNWNVEYQFGIPPNEGWQARVAKAAARPVHLVQIPEAYEDLNELDDCRRYCRADRRCPGFSKTLPAGKSGTRTAQTRLQGSTKGFPAGRGTAVLPGLSFAGHDQRTRVQGWRVFP